MYFDSVDPPNLYVYQILWSFSFSLLPPLLSQKEKKMTHTHIHKTHTKKSKMYTTSKQTKNPQFPAPGREVDTKYYLNQEAICN